MILSRRHFLGWGTLGATAGFGCLLAPRSQAAEFGALQADPNGILDLPNGFSYIVLQRTGDLMSDGNPVRGAPDGMAAFAGSTPNEIILMRNHELTDTGGVSRLILNAQSLEIISSNDVLIDTSRNCAGGPSPWGWLTCEEHSSGGVWVCPLDAATAITGAQRQRLDAYGSFNHEAVCVDPVSLVAYLTEDHGSGFLYRMLPTDRTLNPFVGSLQAMKVVGVSDFNTEAMGVGDVQQIEWVAVDPATPRAGADAQGASIVVRGEGIWWFEGVVYFSATTHGQVFQLTPEGDGGSLKLIANSLQGPDNLTVAPWGDLFVAEDTNGSNFIRVINPQGQVSEFARNAVSDSQEIAGVCFSPDGRTLFANLQKSGHTLAIQGPFPSFVPPSGSGGSPGQPGASPAGSAGTNSGNAGGGGEANVGGAPGSSGGAGGYPAAGGGANVGGAPGSSGGAGGYPAASGGVNGASASVGTGGGAQMGLSDVQGMRRSAGEGAGCGCATVGVSSNLTRLASPAAIALAVVGAVAARRGARCYDA